VIPRILKQELLTQLGEFPIVTVLGPRQASKTTLARSLLPNFECITLEAPETLETAREDPRGFLAQRQKRVILDETQRAPHLLGYLQGLVNEAGISG
jgi:predicted AAA+ superfamily ATPase